MLSNDGLILLREIESRQLLVQLIRQMNKDANLSGVNFNCSESASAEQFVSEVYRLLLNLIRNDFGSYLNLLYRIDLSENTLLLIKDTDPERIARQVTLLTLKREYQKVLFKSKNR